MDVDNAAFGRFFGKLLALIAIAVITTVCKVIADGISTQRMHSTVSQKDIFPPKESRHAKPTSEERKTPSPGLSKKLAEFTQDILDMFRSSRHRIPIPEKKWCIWVNEELHGPFITSDIQRAIREGKLHEDVAIQNCRTKEWRPVREFQEFKDTMADYDASTRRQHDSAIHELT